MPETKDLKLEKGRLSDWEDMFLNVWSRPECARYMFWDLTFDAEAARERMERTVRFQKAHPHAWTVFEKAGGRAIGFAGVDTEDGDTAAEQGICLCPEYWGRGYGMQILQVLMVYARTELGAKRFICRCRPENAVSRHLIEKCGFSLVREESVLDHRDERPCVLLRYEKDL